MTRSGVWFGAPNRSCRARASVTWWDVSPVASRTTTSNASGSPSFTHRTWMMEASLVRWVRRVSRGSPTQGDAVLFRGSDQLDAPIVLARVDVVARDRHRGDVLGE